MLEQILINPINTIPSVYTLAEIEDMLATKKTVTFTAKSGCTVVINSDYLSISKMRSSGMDIRVLIDSITIKASGFTFLLEIIVKKRLSQELLNDPLKFIIDGCSDGTLGLFRTTEHVVVLTDLFIRSTFGMKIIPPKTTAALIQDLIDNKISINTVTAMLPEGVTS